MKVPQRNLGNIKYPYKRSEGPLSKTNKLTLLEDKSEKSCEHIEKVESLLESLDNLIPEVFRQQQGKEKQLKREESGLGVQGLDFSPLEEKSVILSQADKNLNPSHRSNVPKKVRPQRPQDDFDSFVNGAWANKTVMPSIHSSWGPWVELEEQIQEQIRTIIEDLERGIVVDNGKNVKLNHAEKLLRVFWKSGLALHSNMDINIEDERDEETGNVNNAYVKCRNTLFSLVKTVDSKKSLSTICGELLKYDLGPVNFSQIQDQNYEDNEKPNLYANLVADGLTLDNPSYYLSNQEEMKNLRKHFMMMVKYTNEWVPLDPDNELNLNEFELAKAILGLEIRLAAINPSMEDLRQNHKTYNKVKVSDLKKRFSSSGSSGSSDSNSQKGWNWQDWLKASKFDEQLRDEDYVIVQSESYLKNLAQLATSINPGVWRAYLRFSIARKFGTLIRPRLFHEVLTILLTGQQDMASEYQLVLKYLNDALGDILGSLYVKKHFSLKQKRGVLEMIDNLKAAFKRRILKLDWMELETKDQAINKLERLRPLIGYPDDLPSYDDVSLEDLDPENIIGNYILFLEYNYNGWRTTIGKPQTPGVWQMHPHVINAYCDFEKNEIVFPAAILQPPFYDPNAQMAHNYGGIGAIIGHEITHAFDDQGSQFDALGRTVDWWTPRDRKEFELRTQKIVDQFDGIRMANVSVNGSLTQGENIADLGGLLTAYDAMMNQLKHGKQENSEDNRCHNDSVSSDYMYQKQQFFVAWALVWREIQTEEALRDQILTDSHAPHKLRINMPLSNMAEFYDAFYVKKGDRLYREDKDRVKIW